MELNKDMFADAKKCKFIVHEDEAKIIAFAEKNGNEVQIF